MRITKSEQNGTRLILSFSTPHIFDIGHIVLDRKGNDAKVTSTQEKSIEIASNSSLLDSLNVHIHFIPKTDCILWDTTQIDSEAT